jgi:hypothetical protein
MYLVLCFVSDAKKPNYGQGTLIAVPLLTKGTESGAAWNAVLESSNENAIRVKVIDSCTAVNSSLEGGGFLLLLNELATPSAELRLIERHCSD